MRNTCKPGNRGFTLVELLVVIVIIASLAALALTVGPRMLARAKASEAMENIRQISPLLTLYAADHAMTLPPISGSVAQPDGIVVNQQWSEVCLSLLYPATDPAEFKSNAWWEKNKVILRNPLLKSGWSPLVPGYAMNEMIVENLQAANPQTNPGADPLAVGIPMALITSPERTPLIAPFNDFHFRFDDSQISGFNRSPLKDLLVEGKIPVLFVDGHLEVMTPKDYQDRQLSRMPMVSVGTTVGQ